MRQAACPALVERCGCAVLAQVLEAAAARDKCVDGAQCAALERVLTAAAEDRALTRALMPWLVALVVVRFFVRYVDHESDKAYRWKRLLACEALSVSLRLGVVGVSVWQLVRSWDRPSRLLETRVLAVAVAFDAALALNHAFRLVFIAFALVMARWLCTSGLPTCKFSDETGVSLSVRPHGRGPLGLREELLQMVSDNEYITHLLLQAGKQAFLTGPSYFVWLAACVPFFSCLALCALLSASVGFSGLSAFRKLFVVAVWHRWSPLFGSMSSVFFVCLNGHQGDAAVAALEDQLRKVPSGVQSGRDVYHPPLPLESSHTLESLRGRSLEVESFARREFGFGHRRLQVLAELVRMAALEFFPAGSPKLLTSISYRWWLIRSRAPLTGLAIRTGLCPTSHWRAHVLGTGLASLLKQHESYGVASATLTEVVIDSPRGSATHCRTRALGAGIESLMEVRQSDSVVEPAARLGAHLAALLLFGLRALSRGVAVLQHGYWWARAPTRAYEALSEGVFVEDWHQLRPSAGDSLRDDTTEDSAEFDHAVWSWWRRSWDYHRPLLDDWGPTNRAPPPLWVHLVTADGGLATFAACGLRPWMLVADVAIDDFGDLYLAIGLPSQLAGHSPAEACSADVEQGGMARGGLSQVEDYFLNVLCHLPEARVAVMKRLEWSGETTVADARLGFDEEDPCLDPRLSSLPPGLAEATSAPLSGNGTGHKLMLAQWHKRWKAVLEYACRDQGVEDAARAAVLDLPLVGFYPAMRVALDALCGRWEPLAAAALSSGSRIVPQWPPNLDLSRLQLMEACLHRFLWPLDTAHVAGLMASLFLSTSTAAGADFRSILRLDAASKTLLPPDAGELDAVTALAAVMLTGHAATHNECDIHNCPECNDPAATGLAPSSRVSDGGGQAEPPSTVSE